MGFIHHHHGLPLLGQGQDIWQQTEIAIHAKHTVGDNQAAAMLGT